MKHCFRFVVSSVESRLGCFCRQLAHTRLILRLDCSEREKQNVQLLFPNIRQNFVEHRKSSSFGIRYKSWKVWKLRGQVSNWKLLILLSSSWNPVWILFWTAICHLVRRRKTSEIDEAPGLSGCVSLTLVNFPPGDFDHFTPYFCQLSPLRLTLLPPVKWPLSPFPKYQKTQIWKVKVVEITHAGNKKTVNKSVVCQNSDRKVAN